ncbi:DUF4059 family protein [Streptococcus sp. DD13]|uniref:DUF4059 family protein n=1 Tax=Streptococcus sp. DD13 TaxID=1777881 RepID=UPI0007965C8B|nr:DUF4059 family protein [Streptococcus sp. DD13]KXT78216.1 hypothetical protein STRDD13_00934 [Streptococcus sp. DD13]
MLNTILGLYLQSLFIAAVGMLVVCGAWLLWHLGRHHDSEEERRSFVFDLLIIYVMTVPIFAFAVIGLQLIVRAR